MPTTPRTRRAKGSPNGAAAAADRSALAEIDLLGERDAARRTYNMLAALQARRRDLEQLQLLNELPDDGQVPEQGAGTFAEEQAKVTRRIETITARSAHLMGAVKALAERQQRQESEEEARLDAMSAEERASERERLAAQAQARR